MKARPLQATVVDGREGHGEAGSVSHLFSRRRLRVAFVGSWVPRHCGIATFTRDLRDAVTSADPDAEAAVLAIDEPGLFRIYDDDAVVGRIRQDDHASYRAAASLATLWGADVVNIQHEFGLYGTHSSSGYADHLVALLEALPVPAITTLHTVLPDPQPWMRATVRAIAERSAAIVVMAETAARLLREDYDVPRPPVVIPHGAPPVTRVGRNVAKERLGATKRRVVSTFGLVDQRKGIEYAIEAMPEVVARHPDVLYLVAGQTHPAVVRSDGEAYRERLRARVASLGLEPHVRFIDEYLTLERIVELLAATDVYLTPYLDPNQITSGTLAYALGAGRAIVSTRYLHAAESLAGGRGILVDFRAADQIAAALLRVLGDPELQRGMEARAAAYGRQAAWPAVGAQVSVLMRTIADHEPRHAWGAVKYPHALGL